MYEYSYFFYHKTFFIVTIVNTLKTRLPLSVICMTDIFQALSVSYSNQNIRHDYVTSRIHFFKECIVLLSIYKTQYERRFQCQTNFFIIKEILKQKCMRLLTQVPIPQSQNFP